jgi:hypothetical protein
VRGPNEAQWVRRLREELDDIRVAFAHLEDIRRADDAARLAVSLVWPGVFRMGYGLLGYCDRSLELLGDADHPRRAELSAAAGMRAVMTDDLGRARAVAAALEAQAGPPPLMYHWLQAFLSANSGDFSASVPHFEHLASAGEIDMNVLASAVGLGLGAVVAIAIGQIATASQLLSRTQVLSARSSNPSATAVTFYAAAHHHGFGLGDHTLAVEAAEEAFRLARSVDNQSCEIYAAQALIELHLVRGDDEAVITTMRPCIDDCSRYGTPSAALYNLPWALPVLQRRNETELSAMLYGFLMGRYWQARSEALLEEAVQSLQATLGSSEFERLAELGRHEPLDDIVRDVRAALIRQTSSGQPFDG